MTVSSIICAMYAGLSCLAALVRRGLSLLFTGERCLCCGAVRGGVLCPACAEERLLRFAPPGEGRCAVCGKVLLGEDGLCFSCREGRVLHSPDGVFPLHAYRLWNKSLLFEWKLAGARSLSPVFADALYRALGSLYGNGAVPPLVPVPPRPGKIRRTGWDQIAELCACLHRRHALAVLPLLVRLSGEQQKKKSRAERLKSPARYALSRRALRLRAVPEEVVLVDDVITTGATVEACAGLLKAAGVIKVQVLSLFIVD